MRLARGTLFRRCATLAGLWLAVVLIWCAINGRFSPASWNYPTSYRSDSINELAIIRAASQGHYLPVLPKFVPNLGAPESANWNDMPSTEDFHYAAFGALAAIFGLMPAANLSLLLAFLLSATTFFWACRLLHCRRLWSFVGALLYAFSHYACHRGFDHLELTYVAHLPLALVATWWLGSGALRNFRDWRSRFALAVALISGLHNVYYTNVLVQFGLFALLANLLGARSERARLQAVPICAAFVAALLAGFLIGNIDTLAYGFLHGENSATLVRSYAGVEQFALKPIELLLPGPAHRLPAFRHLAQEYLRLTPLRGESRAGYLGLVGIAALLCLLLAPFIRR
ncbi:MAG: hypothetical protein M3Z22_04230, partial [Verrucomicrobiota bacterium]|nr:hypothetical protein [Verrucomicrobiota bacterium]